VNALGRPAEVAARDRAGQGRPIEGEDERLAVAFSSSRVQGPGFSVFRAGRSTASLVVSVVRGEDKPGVAGP